MFATRTIRFLAFTRLRRVKNNISKNDIQLLTNRTFYSLKKTSKPIYIISITYLFTIGLFLFLMPMKLKIIIINIFSKLPIISSLHFLLVTFIDLGIERRE